MTEDFQIHSVSWVRIWAHTNTMLSGQPGHRVNLVGNQRAKIRLSSTERSMAWRTTWRQITPLLQQLEDGNVMRRING